MSSDYSDSEQSIPEKKLKEQITEAQRKARLENLKKGREVRQANLNKKESKPAKTKYKVEYSSDSESDTDSDSSEEFELKSRKKTKHAPKRGQRRNDGIAELKDMVMQLAKQQKRKKSYSKINPS